MKISVAMATYNGAPYLEEQILSILQQELKPNEIIVCDDGSTDGTLNILKKFQQSGDIKYFVNPQKLGLIENFKKATSLCDAESYVALSDQDDVWLPDKLRRCAAAMQEFEDTKLPCMVYSDLILVDVQKNILNNSFRSEVGQDKYQLNLQSLLYNNFVNGCTVLMNLQLRSMFESAPAKTYINHDGWLALLAFTFGKAVAINEPLVYYRKHDNNLSIDSSSKPYNRYLNVLSQLWASFKGEDDFLVEQLNAVNEFYRVFKSRMEQPQQMEFEQFLSLQNKGYFKKKLAYRNMIDSNQL